MINKQELRIGNWVTPNDSHRYFKVLGLGEYTPVLSRVTGKSSCRISDYGYSDLRGIPLTPDIVEKHLSGQYGRGIGTTNVFYTCSEHKDVVLIQYVELDQWHATLRSFDGNEICFLARLQYLHDLQNLHFALTRQELTFTP